MAYISRSCYKPQVYVGPIKPVIFRERASPENFILKGAFWYIQDLIEECELIMLNVTFHIVQIILILFSHYTLLSP